MIDFSSETMKAKKQWNDIFKEMKFKKKFLLIKNSNYSKTIFKNRR